MKVVKVTYLNKLLSVIFILFFILIKINYAQQSYTQNFPAVQDSLITQDSVFYNFDELGKDVVIINNTITKLGADFFDLFYNAWGNLPHKEVPLNIIIDEKPFRGINTQVSISIEDNVIFQQFLQPRHEYLVELADYAVQISMEYVNNYEIIQKDLQGEDLRGSGIY